MSHSQICGVVLSSGRVPISLHGIQNLLYFGNLSPLSFFLCGTKQNICAKFPSPLNQNPDSQMLLSNPSSPVRRIICSTREHHASSNTFGSSDRTTDSGRDCSDKDYLTDREMLCCGTARRRWNQFLKQEREKERLAFIHLRAH